MNYESRVNWWKRVFHFRYIEDRKYPGWKDFLPFYRFHCPIHGFVISYPHGYERKLICPKCIIVGGKQS